MEGHVLQLPGSYRGRVLHFFQDQLFEDLSLDIIAEAMHRMPAKKYLEDHVAMLARNWARGRVKEAERWWG